VAHSDLWMTRVSNRLLYGGLEIAVAAGLLLFSGRLAAQSPVDSKAGAGSRASLEAAAKEAERIAASSSGSAEQREQKRREATAIEERLREGDFRVGDRIELTSPNNKDLTGSFGVREGRMLELPNLPPISLVGVLHSELQGYLVTQLSRYLRDPSIEARSPVRLAVLGQVSKPGFYSVTSDALVSDVIMTAGGPTQTADLTQTFVRRGDAELYTKETLHNAVSGGATLDELDLRAGDEIVVGEKSKRGFGSTLAYAGAVAGLVTTVVLLVRH